MNQRLACAALRVVLFALAACSDRNNHGAATVIAADSDALPVPADADGSVTGMPDAPGPGHIGPPARRGERCSVRSVVGSICSTQAVVGNPMWERSAEWVSR